MCNSRDAPFIYSFVWQMVYACHLMNQLSTSVEKHVASLGKIIAFALTMEVRQLVALMLSETKSSNQRYP